MDLACDCLIEFGLDLGNGGALADDSVRLVGFGICTGRK
jgi:hypothetical protein